MGWVGVIFLMIIIFYCDYPAKVRKLEKKVKKLERNEKGDLPMSKIISSLVGEKCKIITQTNILGLSTEDVVDILEVDDEWVKVSFTHKKDDKKVRIISVEDINRIEVVSE
ncbi:MULTISPECIES: hypothetical protein [unclassified Clostridium]|uniref:hypothetical protein n=1 Tax=unclassified Clostridium TaxID=2614128 RepID=UPI0025BF4029|nr:hypothetical protein [Clostridium sp.]